MLMAGYMQQPCSYAGTLMATDHGSHTEALCRQLDEISTTINLTEKMMMQHCCRACSNAHEASKPLTKSVACHRTQPWRLGPNMGMRTHGARAADRMGRQHANPQKTVTIQNIEDWF